MNHWLNEVAQAAPGAIGSALALRWVPGDWRLKAWTWVGGCALAYYTPKPLAKWMSITDPGGIGLIGLAVGMFGMVVVGKVYEALSHINGKELSERLLAWLPKAKGGE